MSEKSLDKLITTLKSEAIEAADKKALEILGNAKEQADKIITEAEAKSEALLKNAEKEAQAILSKGENALHQAARDVNVAVRHDVLQLLGAVLENEVEAAFTPSLIEKVVLKIADNLDSGVSLKLPDTLEKDLAAQIWKRLQASDNLITISKDSSLNKGVSIVKTDQGWSYHISPEEVTELLHAHLSPRWIQILKNEENS